MRAFKYFAVIFVFAMLLANSQAAQAQMYTYELGPFHVDGLGTDAADSQADAYGNMWDFIVSIESTLPPNHVVLDCPVIIEGHINPYHYSIDFYIIVWDQTPPGPPMW